LAASSSAVSLLQPIVRHAVDATVADVSYDRSAGQQQQRTTRRAHVTKFFVQLASSVDLAIGATHGFAERVAVGVFVESCVEMRDVVDGQFAGQFSSSVCSHPVSDNEQVALLLPVLDAAGQGDGHVVLIGRSTHTDIA